VQIIGVTRKRASDLLGLRMSSEDGNTVPTLLAMPDGPVPGVANGGFRKFLLRSLQFLEADDIRRGVLQPSQQIGQAGVDAIDIVGRNFHAI